MAAKYSCYSPHIFAGWISYSYFGTQGSDIGLKRICKTCEKVEYKP